MARNAPSPFSDDAVWWKASQAFPKPLKTAREATPRRAREASDSRIRNAAPSPRFSPARVASNGRQGAVSRIIREPNPCRWKSDRDSLPPTATISAWPLRIRFAPKMTALAAEEQAVERVVAQGAPPKWAAMASVDAPQSCRGEYAGKIRSVRSMPPTVVPPIRGIPARSLSPACARASSRAKMPIREVLDRPCGAPHRSAISASESLTSPTGKAFSSVCRKRTGAMPERPCRRASRVSPWPHPTALTTPAPVTWMTVSIYFLRLAAT